MALVSRSPLAQTASFWAQGGIAAALAADDSPELHIEDTLAAGRERGRGQRRAGAVRGVARRACATSSGSGVSFDADRHGNLALGLEGGHSRRRDRARGRLGDRPAHHARAVRARRAWTSGSRCSSRAPPPRSRPTRAAASAWSPGPRRGDALPVLARAVVLATGGMAALWQRTTNPRGAVGAGLLLAHAAGAALADLEFMQFHPTALRRDGAARRLPDHRGGARRGRDAARRRRRALRRRAGPARPGGAGDPGRAASAAASRRQPRHALGRRGALPQHRGRARGGRASTRARDLVPVAPAAHYTMGGVATDLDGRSSLPGLYAIGECACTGPARRQPAGLELAGRVLRVRPPRRARGGGRPRAAAGGRARRRDPHRAAARRDARGALAPAPGSSATPAGLRELLDDPFPLARLIARLLPRARGEPRRPPAHRPSRTPTPRSTTCIRLSRRERGRASSNGPELDELFREAMAHLASGVAVITARRADGRPAASPRPRSSPTARTRRRCWCRSGTARAATTRSPSASASACTCCAPTRSSWPTASPTARPRTSSPASSGAGTSDVPELARVLAYLRCRRAENFVRYDHTVLIGDLEAGRARGGRAAALLAPAHGLADVPDDGLRRTAPGWPASQIRANLGSESP